MSPHSIPVSSPITRDVAGRAVDALLAFLRASAKNSKAQLFEHDDLLHLHLTLRRIPSTSRLKPLRVPLPHSLHPLDRSRTSLCLIVNDSNADAVRSTAAAENLPFDSVIPLSQLRTDYVPFEARRRLCDSYDIFFAERCILPILPRLLGNYFFRKKKLPLAVDVSRKGWPEAIRQACRSTLLYLWAGNCCGLKVGRVSMDREQIVDNLMAAIEGAVELVPKKWANVRSIFIKEVQSVALPIYQVIPEIGMRIDVAPIKKEKPLVVQEGDGRKGVEKKAEKKGNSKKRKLRIHDVGNLGDDHEGTDVEGNGDVGLEEQESDALGVEKSKKKKKERKGKMNKGKKGRTTGDDEDGGEFIELGGERRKRKKLKKIVNSEVKTCGKDHDFVIADKEVNGLSINADAAADDENGDDHEGRDEEGNGDVGLEEQESGALGVEKKKKGRKGKLNKGKKDRTAGDDEDGGEFIELGSKRKKRKKSKNIVNFEVKTYGKDHDFVIDDKEVNALSINADDENGDGHGHGDGEELQLKKRGKNNKKRSKAKKGKND